MLYSQEELRLKIASQLREQRLARNLTQAKLASKSNVSLASLKRFESTGKISLESLIKIAFALNTQKNLENLFVKQNLQGISIEELLEEKPKRQRGRN